MNDFALATPRLVLREPRERDAAALRDYHLRNAERFERWDPPRPRDLAAHVERIREARRASANDGFVAQFVAVLAADAERAEAPITGTVTLDGFDRFEPGASVSYTLDAALEGRGYASEAVGAVLTYGFERLGLASISAYYDVRNARSEALLARLGFRPVVMMPPLPGPNGDPRSQVFARLTRSDYGLSRSRIEAT